MKFRLIVIPFLVFFTLLKPLTSFLFHDEIGLLSNVEWAMDMDNDGEKEQQDKDENKDKSFPVHVSYALQKRLKTEAIFAQSRISNFTTEIHLPPPEGKVIA